MPGVTGHDIADNTVNYTVTDDDGKIFTMQYDKDVGGNINLRHFPFSVAK